MLASLLLLIAWVSASAPRSCIVPTQNQSEACPTDCALLASADGAEIVGEFACVDGGVYQCTAPYAQVASSVQRALLEPTWARPDLAAGTYRTNTLGDGWFVPCAVSDLKGDGLLDSYVSEDACDDPLTQWACVCPLVEVPVPGLSPTVHTLKIRAPNASHSLGTSLGYALGNFTVYDAGYYTVSSATTRNLTLISAGSTIRAQAVEWADFAGNFTLLQVTAGVTEHELGDSFGWNGTHLIVPYTSVWEFVPSAPANFSGVGECGVWCASRLDGGLEIETDSANFFMRDVL